MEGIRHLINSVPKPAFSGWIQFARGCLERTGFRTSLLTRSGVLGPGLFCVRFVPEDLWWRLLLLRDALGRGPRVVSVLLCCVRLCPHAYVPSDPLCLRVYNFLYCVRMCAFIYFLFRKGLILPPCQAFNDFFFKHFWQMLPMMIETFWAHATRYIILHNSVYLIAEQRLGAQSGVWR